MNINKNELFNEAKDELKKEVSPIAFETWFKPLEIQSIVGNKVTILATSEYHKDFIETRYLDLISNTLRFISNMDCVVSIVTSSDIENSSSLNDTEISSPSKKPFLNPKYTFENFVVGDNNSFAHAACLAVSEKPAIAYNPLFLYGGVGLGKTHLMQAIANRILENFPDFNVLYVTSEKFTNQLINAIKDGKNEMFRKKYRNIDVLLIDDIQFIAGKKSVQEEFFHTFNSLHGEGKQIILTSDRKPSDIPFLEDRIKSRFDGGLLADIDAPNYETRFAILRKKAQDENIVIDDFILSDIANKIDSNIRELEGAFNKIVARASLTHSPITIELAEKIISEFKVANEKIISADYIKDVVSNFFNIDKDALSSNKRSSDIAFPRQVAMFLCRDVANMSFPKIGEAFGNRDHSTVMHACKKIEKEIKEKANIKILVESVKNLILKDKT